MKHLLVLAFTVLLTGCLHQPQPGEIWAIRNYDDKWCTYPRMLVLEVADGSVKVLLYKGTRKPFVSAQPIRDFVGPFSSMKLDPHKCQPNLSPDISEEPQR